jgi:hypothetical protein
MSKFWRVFWDSDGSPVWGGAFDALEEAADLELTDYATIVEVSNDEPVKAWRRHAGSYKCVGDRSEEEFQKVLKAMTAEALTAGREPPTGPFYYGTDPVYSTEVEEPPRLVEVPLSELLDGE